MQNHRAKLKNYTNNNIFSPIKKPGTAEDHTIMTSHIDAIKKCDQSTIKQGNIYSDNQNQEIKNTYKKKLENRNSQ